MDCKDGSNTTNCTKESTKAPEQQRNSSQVLGTRTNQSIRRGKAPRINDLPRGVLSKRAKKRAKFLIRGPNSTSFDIGSSKR